MSLCPECGRVYCDHTAAERGQTNEEMERPLTKEEIEAWARNPDSTGYKPEKLRAARNSQKEAREKQSAK